MEVNLFSALMMFEKTSAVWKRYEVCSPRCFTLCKPGPERIEIAIALFALHGIRVQTEEIL
jgi:hypothetical protein